MRATITTVRSDLRLAAALIPWRTALLWLALFLASLATPVLLFAAEVAAQVQTAPETAFGKLAFAVLTPLLGWVATRSYDGIKTIIPGYDSLSPTIHAALAPIFQLVFGFLAANLGVPGLAEVMDLHGLTADLLNAVFVAAVGHGIFRAEKRKAPADATVILNRTPSR